MCIRSTSSPNLMGMLIFPFIARPILPWRVLGNISQAEFEQLMIERKKLIPEWIKGMIVVNK